MTQPDPVDEQRIPLTWSQRNIFNGVLQDADPALYLIGRSYRFRNLELPVLLAALEATIRENPVQLCVLAPPRNETGYPDLVPQLQTSAIVDVQPDDEYPTGGGGQHLQRSWESGILSTPLVRYTVRVDASGHAAGLEVHTHHLLLDGGATGIIEADLGRHIASGGAADIPSVGEGLTRLAQAHRGESRRVTESQQRLAEAAKREIADDAGHGGYGQTSRDAPGTAAKGVLRELVSISGASYDAILAVADVKQIPLNVLVAAAAVAVDAGLRQSTESLLVHAIDNRFGEPELNVATCLVNSVAQSVRFPAFASVEDVVRSLDRGYVKAIRRRWLREEQYRRMYLAINRTSHVEALTLNFLRAPCAPELRDFLTESPVTTDIGPIESRTVAGVLDEERRTLDLGIWDRADQAATSSVAARIAAVLESMASTWDQPIATTVDEWKAIGSDGRLAAAEIAEATDVASASAWFTDPTADWRAIVQRQHVDSWIAWLVHHDVAPGDVVVLADDGTAKTVDLLIASHLAGCGYSVCDRLDEIPLRANSITRHDGGSAVAVDVSGTRLDGQLDQTARTLVAARTRNVAHDPMLGARTAYVMPTSGSTGEPKLVRITHGSLAVFCAAIRRAYGWGPDDTVMQCAPLTSDISVEEIFGAAFSGSRLVRSAAMTAGDLPALAADLAVAGATVVDLPTAVWHLLCEDREAMATIRCSALRQVVIGGEPIRPRAVEVWVDSVAPEHVSLISTYGPTEATVVVTYLPMMRDGSVLDRGARCRVGQPIEPGTIFVAFGEIVIIGDLVSSGYLGVDSDSFGVVAATDGSRHRAFATADRVSIDADGFPVFAGRRDAIVKVSGKRVDTAAVTRRVTADPAVSDAVVELYDGGLGVWFETPRTREDDDDGEVEARIRNILTGMHVSSFFVAGVSRIPRKANGKADGESLRAMRRFNSTTQRDRLTERRADGLAEIWSRHLGKPIRADASLLDEGVGSLDLIRILPETRTYLERHLTILDLISADSAANLVEDSSGTDSWMDACTVAEIEHDLAAARTPRAPGPGSETVAQESILVLGASGILGTGFAEAVLELKRSGARCPDVILAARTKLVDGETWTALSGVAGVRIEHLPPDAGPAELQALIGQVGARAVVNCIGNTNVLVPYRELRSANVELVSAITEGCTRSGARLMHSSTYIVNGEVGVARVTDPREAPYPYAAAKSLAELIVAASPRDLDYTIVRLPRVLGGPGQLRTSADVLVSIVSACAGVHAYPAVRLTEQVTTGRAAAEALLGLLPEVSGSAELGRGITVVRGEAVDYSEFLSSFGSEELEVAEWKHRLDSSAWAERNPRRWSVIDAWISLGMRLGPRSYAQYLAQYPTIELDVASVTEMVTRPGSLGALLAGTPCAPSTT